MTFTNIGQSARTQVEKNPLGDGPRHGATGAVTSPLSLPEIAAWLAKQRPVEVDKAAVSRASSHGVGLRIRYEGRYPSGPNGERLPSYTVATGCDIAPGGNIDAALADLINFMTPAPIRQLEGWLAELSVIVARRQDDQFGNELRVSAYSSRLSRYPADVVKAVLFQASYKFWPTWEELEKRCEAMAGPRRQMIAALEHGPEPPEPAMRPPTDAEKARVQALVDELFLSKTAEERNAAADIAMAGNCIKDMGNAA